MYLGSSRVSSCGSTPAKKRPSLGKCPNANAACGNEEPGEISFSVLARATKGDTKVSKFDHMDTLYAQLRTYMEASREFRIGRHLSEFYKSGRLEHKEGSDSIQTTVFYIKTVIRRLTTKIYTRYDGEQSGYRSLTLASHHQSALEIGTRFATRALEGQLLKEFEKLRGKVCSDVMGKFKSIWPQANVANKAPVEEPEVKMVAKARKAGQAPSRVVDCMSGAETDEEDEAQSEIYPEYQLAPIPDDNEPDVLDCGWWQQNEVWDQKRQDDEKAVSGAKRMVTKVGAHLALAASSAVSGKAEVPGSPEVDIEPEEEDEDESGSDGGFFEQAAIAEPTPYQKKKARICEYDTLSQHVKQAVWASHTAVNEANVVEGPRKRTKKDTGPFLQD